MFSQILVISQNNAVSAATFVFLNAATVVGLCSLYTAYLFFLHRKRIRTGSYGTFTSEE